MYENVREIKDHGSTDPRPFRHYYNQMIDYEAMQVLLTLALF